MVQLLQVRCNRTRITASDRPGECAVTEPKRVVERRMQEGCDQPLRRSHTGRGHDLHRLRHQRHEVVGAVREPRVVHRPVPFLDPHRLGAHLNDERLGDRTQGSWRGDPEATLSQALHIHRGACERHSRMQRQPEHVVTGCGVEDRSAITARRVHDQLSRLPRARGAESRDQAREDVIRDCEQDQLRSGDDLFDRHDGYAGEQRRCPLPRQLADPRDGHQPVAGLLKCGTKNCTHATGADDADVQPGGSLTSHRQVAHARNARPFGVRRNVLPVTWTPWMQAWEQGLYGQRGFYRQTAGPAGHFSTASQGIPRIGELLARALLKLMDQEGLDTFVDMGCGRGELLEQVHRLGPHLRCIGVDVVARPALSEPIGWFQSPGGAHLPDELEGLTHALAFANEWLDVVPCPIAQMDDGGELREVLVDASSGDESLGDPVAGTDREWCQWFWPIEHLEPGDRVEIGETRDTAWDDLVSRVASGLAVAVDYGHTIESRPALGTLTGFRQGRQVPPVPDGSCDLTAHVAMDSVAHDSLVDQRTVLKQLGVSGQTPPHDLARRNPSEYLQSLSTASVATMLTAKGGLGDFLWAFTRVS